ncbi:3-isopropylmalate dehydratase large subunit [bacterium]|nr:3-isopropylmalate dehydratase large subunit [bacterium]
MAQTMIEKIISEHCGTHVKPGEIVELIIDTRVARDFGGANVVRHLIDNNLEISDHSRTYFTFDCNPGGSDQKYASNQHFCRRYAREHDIRVFDIQQGIGTHIAIDEGLVLPGETFVSTDSHANILGAIGAFGQGMGDQDIAYAFAQGKVWFQVPPSIRIELTGTVSGQITAKDITLRLLEHFGASGLLGYAAEMSGPLVDRMSLSDRITLASMATEMAGIIILFPPNERVLNELPLRQGKVGRVFLADEAASYSDIVKLDLTGLEPMAARPGHPEDVVPVNTLAGIPIDSGFIGSCTNGRYEDMCRAAALLQGKRLPDHIILKIVPATDRIWRKCLAEGLITIFKEAGALVGNPGCAGCAAGQIGQNGPQEVTISSGNRNFLGKQGKGDVYLASPDTVVASALAGAICSASLLPEFLRKNKKGTQRVTIPSERSVDSTVRKWETVPSPTSGQIKSEVISGKVWVISQNNIDTDMIFHNQHLTVTNIEEMGQYTFGNLSGWEDFSQKAQPGDIVVTGGNFGAGSSRQQAVDCFKSLGISLIVAQSFGAIYERNAINAGLPLLKADLISTQLVSGDTITVNLLTGLITLVSSGHCIQGTPFSQVQWDIFQRGGLLKSS